MHDNRRKEDDGKFEWELGALSAFGKIDVVYGHIDENGRFVRKRPVPKMPITDKMGKIGSLSVKCVLLTDKSSKKGPLSVNLDEILAELVEQHCI